MTRADQKCTIGEVCAQMIHATSPHDTSPIEFYLRNHGVIYPNISLVTTEQNSDKNQRTTTTTTTTTNPLPEPTWYQQLAYYLPPLQSLIPSNNILIQHYLTLDHEKFHFLSSGCLAGAVAFDWHDTLFEFSVAKFNKHHRVLHTDDGDDNISPTISPTTTTTTTSIHFYSVMAQQGWKKQVLTHELMNNHIDSGSDDISPVRFIKYRPTSSSLSKNGRSMLVACHNGVLLWHLDDFLFSPPSKSSISSISSKNADKIDDKSDDKSDGDENDDREEQKGICIFLPSVTSGPITCLEWFPEKSYQHNDDDEKVHLNELQHSLQKNVFITASAHDHRVAIWQFDTLAQEWSHWYLSRFNNGVRSCAFSPNGRFLAVFTYGNVFRVWRTSSWTSEKWSCFERPVQCARWSSNSRYLLVSVVGESKIYVIQFNDYNGGGAGGENRNITSSGSGSHRGSGGSGRTGRMNGHNVDGEYLFEIDFANHPDFCNVAGLRIESFELDPSAAGSQRLVVSFEGVKELAVVMCDFNGDETRKFDFALMPVSDRSLIYAPGDAKKVLHFKFWPNFQKGSLLACTWDNGKISLIPFYYRMDSDQQLINW